MRYIYEWQLDFYQEIIQILLMQYNYIAWSDIVKSESIRTWRNLNKCRHFNLSKMIIQLHIFQTWWLHNF